MSAGSSFGIENLPKTQYDIIVILCIIRRFAMDFQMAKEEYIEALARGKKEIRDLTLAKKPIHPAVLD